MRFAYPKSFLKLLLIGFMLAMLPLLFAFGNAAIYLDRLAEQSTSTVTQAVQATRASRVLVEQLNLMERSARQYFVLQDRLLLENYTHAHLRFAHATQELQTLRLNKTQENMLSGLAAKEERLYQEILGHDIESQGPDQLISQFVNLSNQAQDILAENNRSIDRESAVLAETAERTQNMLISQTLTLLPVALLVALVITYLVAQPIRGMDAAIRRLGEGEYDRPISIDGPGDLRKLGERLNWLREQLQQLDQEKQRFLRHISHELKTPLTAIREGSELLSDEVGGSLTPQQQEIAGILRESSLRLQNMIENLLNYSAVQYKKPQLELQTIMLNRIVDEVLSNYALTLGSKKIRVDTDLESFTMKADQEKMLTVVDNLLSNAIKYTPQSGVIRIAVKQQQQMAVIDIQDDGPGVLEADRNKLFDPFYRGNGKYDSLVSGSGLGLSIAKEYVDAHGGEIALLPSSHGAHFQVQLPLNPVISEISS